MEEPAYGSHFWKIVSEKNCQFNEYCAHEITERPSKTNFLFVTEMVDVSAIGAVSVGGKKSQIYCSPSFQSSGLLDITILVL